MTDSDRPATADEKAARLALTRRVHRARKRAEALATHAENRPGRVHGTEFVEWTSELEEGRVPAAEGE